MAVTEEKKSKKKSSSKQDGATDKVKKEKKDKKERKEKKNQEDDKKKKKTTTIESAPAKKPAPKPRKVINIEPEKKKGSYLGDFDLPSSDSESEEEEAVRRNVPEKEKVFISRVRTGLLIFHVKNT